MIESNFQVVRPSSVLKKKIVEVNKGIIHERWMNFDLGPNAQFEGIFEVILALECKHFG